ncbi:hypothetical protein NDU88_008079 [Pleurodeles waltl]|uniref:Uncharacterized protein n=1 Tax=Pleurodeles waltl TaxID=8319 RepID=A0AAV7QMK9_PLEWA|nr:hypothetical protein NDU88_008079 [Pleurodeles waltl]
MALDLAPGNRASPQAVDPTAREKLPPDETKKRANRKLSQVRLRDISAFKQNMCMFIEKKTVSYLRKAYALISTMHSCFADF